MLATALIAFREFFEAFLIIGVFLGVSKKLNLKREFEIICAATTGVLLVIVLVTLVYLLGADAEHLLTEKNADFFENYLLIFSGMFVIYVTRSLHSAMNKSRSKMISAAQNKLEKNAFDISLFFTIVFLILREGFEIALFTAGVSLLGAFLQNVIGLLVGFAVAAVFGAVTFFAYTRFPAGKIFKITEYLMILLGVYLFVLGVWGIFGPH